MRYRRRFATTLACSIALTAAAPLARAADGVATTASTTDVVPVPATTTAAAPATEPATGPVVTAPTTSPALAALLATTGPTSAPTTAPTTALTVRPTTGPGAVLATTQPNRNGTSRRERDAERSAAARAIAGVKPLPAEYELLLRRSIFIKGRQETAFGGTPVTTTQSTEPTTNTFYRPERSLVFEGSTDVDGSIVAFIEDTSQNKVLQLKQGDKLASGTVTAIGFDAIQYTANGRDMRVTIGYNLEGFPGIVATSQPSGPLFGSTGGPGPFGSGGNNGGGGNFGNRYGNGSGSGYRPQMGNNNGGGGGGGGPTPPNAGGSTPGGGGNVDDILAKLRAKRASEMGGK